MSTNTLEVVDLFCGAGGSSTGFLQAAEELGINIKLTAVNHWKTAVNSHALNHPQVTHICEDVETLHPRRVVPSGHLHILSASTECTFHSNARGGGPCNEQSRSQPWQLIRWITDLRVDSIFLENVGEFQHWCRLLTKPLRYKGKYYKKDRPDPRRKGEYFNSFIKTLKDHGYQVEWRIQNSADFGDPTKRKRLILMARLNQPVMWPKVSHGDADACEANSKLKPWLTAREHVIDWSLEGNSIFNRKKPLSPNTIRRIAAGLTKFGGAAAEPFLLMLRGLSESHIRTSSTSVDEPLRTVTSKGTHIGLVEPFLLGQQSCAAPSSVEAPIPTVATAGAISLTEPVVKPFILPQFSEAKPKSVDTPLGTITTDGGSALVEPIIVHSTHSGDRPAHSVDMPLPTVTGAHRGELALVKPVIVQTDQTGSNGGCVQSVDEPIKTVVSKQNMGLVQPILCKYYGTGVAKSVDEPLDTVTTKDRFLLVRPKTGEVLAELDIRFRMLQPHELASAHSFPKNYAFTGNKEDQTKQIGNSVTVNLAKSHALVCLQQL